MSQVESRFPTSSTRRTSFPTDLGVVPLPAATSVKAPEGPDPIFEAINGHDAAMRSEAACLLWQSVLEKNVPADRRTWRFGASHQVPENKTDAPEWVASQMAVGEARDRRMKAIIALLTTPPTTTAGAIALLGYVGTIEYPWEKTGAEKPLLFLFSDWSHDEIKEAARAFPTAVANAMRSMRPTGAQSHY